MNKMIFECKSCGQNYCGNCTDTDFDEWKEFCKPECREDYKIENKP